jgi:SAM-dependent methyltransferase
MLLDPMFPRLAEFIRPTGKIIDVGCGYAVPAAWLLAAYPGLGFLACEPDGERARVAARVLGKSGHVFPCPALDLPLPNEKADAVLLLDVIHYFSDSELRKLLTKMRPVIGVGGKFIIRVTIPGAGFRVFRSMEELKLRCRGVRYYFRSAGQIIRILNEANFRLDVAEPSAPGREETWFVARIREDPLRQAQDQ